MSFKAIKKPVDRDAMVMLFKQIRAAFPHLRMDLKLEHPHVDLELRIPSQPGLTFDVSLNLQGDELHLSAGSCWLEWFPCTSEQTVAEYRSAVTGLLTGEHRILEHCLGSRPVKSELQRSNGGQWESIGTSTSGLRGLVPWRRTRRVLQNVI